MFGHFLGSGLLARSSLTVELPCSGRRVVHPVVCPRRPRSCASSTAGPSGVPRGSSWSFASVRPPLHTHRLLEPFRLKVPTVHAEIRATHAAAHPPPGVLRRLRARGPHRRPLLRVLPAAVQLQPVSEPSVRQDTCADTCAGSNAGSRERPAVGPPRGRVRPLSPRTPFNSIGSRSRCAWPSGTAMGSPRLPKNWSPSDCTIGEARQSGRHLGIREGADLKRGRGRLTARGLLPPQRGDTDLGDPRGDSGGQRATGRVRGNSRGFCIMHATGSASAFRSARDRRCDIGS